jgi:membrane-bound ClpP family serine protease
MSDWAIVALLFLAGMLVFTAEIFIPSHGVLTVVGLGFLVAAIVKTFSVGGHQAGAVAVLACLVILPAFAVTAIKVWPKTPVGRRVAPPNPIVTAADSSVPIEELSSLLGQTGRALTPLRPVGICDVTGRRISCVSPLGLIDAGAVVEAIGISGGNLTVIEKKA